MSDRISLSTFTIEVDRKPILAIQGRKQSEAEELLTDEYVRNQLSLLKCGGKPLCDDFSIFCIRIARASEKELYHKNVGSLLTTKGHLAVLLVNIDDQ